MRRDLADQRDVFSFYLAVISYANSTCKVKKGEDVDDSCPQNFFHSVICSTVQKKCKRNSLFFVLCSRENSNFRPVKRNFASTKAKFRFAEISSQRKFATAKFRNSENSHSRNFARSARVTICSCEISTKRNFAGRGGGLL